MSSDLTGWDELLSRHPWPEERPDVGEILKNTDLSMFVHSKGSIWNGVIGESTKLVLEVGSWLGASCKGMLHKASRETKAICVDHWLGAEEQWDEREKRRQPILAAGLLYDAFLQVMWDYRDRMIAVKNHSLLAMQEIHEVGLRPDAIYIDADHSFAAAYYDISVAHELFPDSILTGDDYDFPGVRGALKKFCSERGYKIKDTGKSWRLIV